MVVRPKLKHAIKQEVVRRIGLFQALKESLPNDYLAPAQYLLIPSLSSIISGSMHKVVQMNVHATWLLPLQRTKRNSLPERRL